MEKGTARVHLNLNIFLKFEIEPLSRIDKMIASN